MKHKITFNSKRVYREKPKGREMGPVISNINTHVEVDIDQLATLQTKYGRIVTAHRATLKDGMKANNASPENFESQSLFYLDIDDGYKLKDIKERLDILGIRPNVIYNTMSHTKQTPKYRVWVALDAVTYDYYTAWFLQEKFTQAFAEEERRSDKSTGNPNRIVYPGLANGVVHKDVVENNYQDFLKSVLRHYYEGLPDEDKPQLLEGYDSSFDVTFELRNIPYSKDNDYNGIKKPKIVKSDSYERVKPSQGIEKFMNNLRIGRDINQLKYRLSHGNFFPLCTNVCKIEGGYEWLYNKMIEFNEKGSRMNYKGKERIYEPSKFQTLYDVRYNRDYGPMSLKDISPYPEDHIDSNLLTITWKEHSKIVRRIEDEPKKISFDEGTEWIIKTYEDLGIREPQSQERIDEQTDKGLFESDDLYLKVGEYKTNIVKIQTGMGKTFHLRKINKGMVCFATHDLKNEFVKKWLIEKENKVEGIDFIVTPDYPIFSNDDINIMLENYNQIDDYDSSSKIIKAIQDGKEINLYSGVFVPTIEDMEKAESYKIANAVFRDDKAVPIKITTHARAMLDPSILDPNIPLIFDEDPYAEGNGVAIHEITRQVADDFHLSDSEIYNFLLRLDRYIKSLPIGQTLEIDQRLFNGISMTKLANFIIRQNRKENNMISILHLFNSKYILKYEKGRDRVMNIAVLKHLPLPEAELTILSATPREDIHQSMPDRVVVLYNSPLIQNAGKVYQFNKFSFARKSLKFLKDNPNSDKQISIRNVLKGNKNVITYLTHREMVSKLFNVEVIKDIYFGKSSGADGYGGQNIIVMGTPNRPAHTIFMEAKLMGHDIIIDDTEHPFLNRIVQRNGYEYQTLTYGNKTLQDIHLRHVEAELSQAIGRARAVKNDCIVLVMSDVIIPNADEYKYEYKDLQRFIDMMKKNDNSMTKLSQTKRTFANI